jgi:hypothetical protein
VGTRRTPAVRATQQLAVSMIVPEGTKPRGGWPVAIFGHGFTRSQLDLLLAADSNARRGIATLALTIPGQAAGRAASCSSTARTARPRRCPCRAGRRFGRGRHDRRDRRILDGSSAESGGFGVES